MTAAVTARRDTDPMTTRAYWLIRYSGFAVVGIAALVNPPHQPHEQLFRAIQIACFTAAGLALLGWLVVDEVRRYRRRGLPIVLGVLAAAGRPGRGDLRRRPEPGRLRRRGDGGGRRRDRVAAGHRGRGRRAFVPIWIVGPIVGSTLGTLVGYPLLIAASLSLGRNRRSYRVQAEQSAALLEQYERLRAEQRRADVLDERTRIAREIHDVLAHSLGALGIQIQAAKAVLTDHGDIDRAVEVLSTAQRMAADGLTETRRAVHALRVDSLPLGDELAGGGGARTGSATRFRSPSRPSARPGRCRPTPPSRCSAPCRRRWSTRPSTRPGSRSQVRLDYGQGDVTLTVVNHLNGSPGGRRHAAEQRPAATG